MSNTSFFDKMYNASSEVIKSIKQPLVKNSLKRKFESARDSAVGSHIEALENLNKEREKINKDASAYDINRIVECRQTAEDAKNTIKFISEEYKQMFGVELADVELEEDAVEITEESVK